MYALAPVGYFMKIVALMGELGFQLLSRVTISTNDFKYHVPATYARDVRFIFYLPGKNLFITLNFNEAEHRKGRGVSYWSIWLDTGIHLSEKRRVPTFATKHFRCIAHTTMDNEVRSFYFEQNWDPDPNAHMLPDVLRDDVVALMGDIIPFLSEAPFPILDLQGWVPSFRFPRCRRLFWIRLKKSWEEIHPGMDFPKILIKRPRGLRY